MGPAQNTSMVGTQHYKTGVCVCMMRIVLATGPDVDTVDITKKFTEVEN